MTTWQIGDHEVLSMSLALSLRGIGTLEAVLDIGDAPAPTGAVRLTYAAEERTYSFAHTILDPAPSLGRCQIFAVAGAGGLRRMLARNESIDDFGAIEPALVLESIITAVGERPALGAVQGLPILPRWSRPIATGAQAIARLAAHLGCGWRVLPDGRVWVGPETWPAYTRELLTPTEPDASGIFEAAVDVPDLLPGVTIGGRRVVQVVYTSGESGRIRARVQLADDRSEERGRSDFARAVANVTAPPSLSQVHRAQVVTQDAAGHVGVRFLDADAPMLTIDDVPIGWGLPSTSADVLAGAIVQIAFLGGREDQPIAGLFEADSPSTKIRIGGGGAPVARKGGSIHCGWLVAVSTPGGGPITGIVIPYDPLLPQPPNSIPLPGIITDGWSGLEVPEP